MCIFLSRSGVLPSFPNSAYTSHDVLVNEVGSSAPINYDDLFNIGDILKFTIDGSCEVVTLLDINIDFKAMVPYFKTRLKNSYDRTMTRGKSIT